MYSIIVKGLKQCQTAKKIKAIALAIAKLHLSVGIKQSGSYSQSVSRKYSIATKSILGQSESLFGLSFT